MEISEYKSFKTAIENIVKNSNRAHVSKRTRQNYLDGLKQYIEFVNSKEGLKKEINPDDLVEEASEDAEKAKERIRFFFLWLQGEPIPNYKPRDKKLKETSAYVRAYAQIRGFYTNNKIVFGKWKTPSVANMKREAIENDSSVSFFRVDKRRKIFLDRGLLKQFLANLKLRDQTIFLATLSSSQDSGDLFRLNVGDVRKQKERERFFWEEKRGKTGVRFKTFFSVEATDFVRRYIEQERKGAGDKDPLFVTTGKRRMSSKHLGSVFRDGARKMGVKLEEGYQNPLRPKRLRHIFRTACNYAHIDEGYINAFMGHKTSISQKYLDKNILLLELEFSKAEPLLTVYGVGGTEGLEAIQTELSEWKGKYADLKVRVEDLEQTVEQHRKFLHDLFDFQQKEAMRKQQQEITDSDIELWKEQAELTERERKEKKRNS